MDSAENLSDLPKITAALPVGALNGGGDELVPKEVNISGDASCCVPRKILKQLWPAMDFAALNDVLAPVILAELSYSSQSLSCSAALRTDLSS